jgi:transcriptional regulator GlxA family with amidase domain|tara:strand:+ start:402271 stop:403248 length:978 start_codon:yes stop_codon:yes gene_type:complete
MKHVSVLLPHYVNLAGLENARQGLLETNEFLKTQGKSPIFNIEIVGVIPEMHVNNGQYAIKADKLLREIKTTDIVIIPPIQNNIAEALQLNHEFYPWVNAQHQAGAQIVSLCLGAFLLASTGLLNGKDCVTHWRASEPFKQFFPKVNLLSDKIMTDEDGIYTGGGAFSSANLILYIIEKIVDRETAIYCSKIFQIDAGRTSQSPFIIFKAQKNHADADVETAQTFIEKNYMNKIIVDDLCNLLGIGRRTFERRFKKATANTILEYIQRTRVEAAKKQLELGVKTVNEIMFDVGYLDTKAFRTTFKKITGLSPVEYKNKYNKVLVS